MSRGLSTDNPIVLFGNIGPDVVKVSQIYDPDNDQYTLSEDVIVQTGKEYFTRSYGNRVITFTPVSHPASTDNPKERGWYEVNAAHVDQTGKYVPAPKSLVVCDVAYENFKARAILIVDSVDDQGENPTFKSTLVPTTTGQDTEISARIVDYGNDRFMFYLEQDGDVVRACPDRKLMLYGHRLYAYCIRNTAGASIAAPTKELTRITNDALIPYSGETTSGVTINSENIAAYKGQLFAVLVGSNYRAVTIPDVSSTSVCCKTLDATYLLGKDYYVEEYAATGAKTYRKLIPGTDYDIGDEVGDLKNADDVGYARIYVTGDQFLRGVTGYTGWLTIPDNPDGAIRYPERCYLKPGVSLSNGETVTMEVYEYEGDSYRMVLSLTLIAHVGSTLEATTKITKQLDHFDVFVENADRDVDGAILLHVGDTTENWIFHPTLVFNDDTSVEVPLDGKQSFMYGRENINSANAGQEFRLLFKYFPNAEAPIHENMAKNFISKTLVVRVVDGSSIKIRKVSTLPLWDYHNYKYVFKFLPYNTDFTEPKVIDEGGTFGQTTVLAFNLASYKDPNGNIRSLDVAQLGNNVGVFQHARLALTANMAGYKTDVYRQNVAMRLQPWTESSIAVKWLLGSYLTVSDGSTIEEYSEGEVPYGSINNAVRPYLECARNTESEGGYVFSIARNMTKADFLLNFYRKGYSEPSELEVGDTIVPDRYRIRSLATVNVYDKLDSEVALEGVNYYKSNGTLVPVVVGKTPVNKYYIHVQQEFRYFIFNDATGEYEEQHDLVIGETLTVVQRETFYILRVKPVVSEWRDIPNTFDDSNRKFVLKVDITPIEGPEFYPTNMLGGPIPTVVGEKLNTQVMGLVVVEFGQYDADTSSYRWIYGVPVEVKFPYTATLDMVYQNGKHYYVFDETNNTFSEESYTGGAEIPSTPQRFERMQDPVS